MLKKSSQSYKKLDVTQFERCSAGTCELHWMALTKMDRDRLYEPPRRGYTIMSREDQKNGKKSNWTELEIRGYIKNLSLELWTFTHLTSLLLNDNNLQVHVRTYTIIIAINFQGRKSCVDRRKLSLVLHVNRYAPYLMEKTRG